jgi:hypothetical protein
VTENSTTICDRGRSRLIQLTVPRVFQDDLPAVRMPRLRAFGVVTPEMSEFVVRLGDVVQSVGVQHLRFPNGGGWSFFVAPCCGRKARVLRLLDGVVICCKCCVRLGVRWRCEPASVKQRAALSVSRLSAMLESEEPLRLKPSTLWSKLERRSRHETALARNEFILSQGRRYRDVLKQTQAMEIEPEPIKKPKIKSPRKR